MMPQMVVPVFHALGSTVYANAAVTLDNAVVETALADNAVVVDGGGTVNVYPGVLLGDAEAGSSESEEYT